MLKNLLIFCSEHNIIVAICQVSHRKLNTEFFVATRPKVRATTPTTLQTLYIAPWEMPKPMIWPTLGQHWRKRRAACPWGMPPTPETVRGRPRHPKIVLGRQRELGREMVPKNVVSGHQERGKRRKRGDQTVEEKYFPALAKQLLMVK